MLDYDYDPQHPQRGRMKNQTPKQSSKEALRERLRVSTSADRRTLAREVLNLLASFPDGHDQSIWWQPAADDALYEYRWPTRQELMPTEKTGCDATMCVAGHIVSAALSLDPETKLAMTNGGSRVIIPISAAGLLASGDADSALGRPAGDGDYSRILWVFGTSVPRCAVLDWLERIADGETADAADANAEQLHARCVKFCVAVSERPATDPGENGKPEAGENGKPEAGENGEPGENEEI